MRLVLLALFVTAACGKGGEPPPPTSGSPNAQRGGGMDPDTQAQKMYASVCANCHGLDGTANTQIAQQLNPRPRAYTDAAWQASITDDQIKQIILQGGGPLGKSPMMTGHPELAQQPGVLAGLVKIIRGFAPKAHP
jgi:hypothetical protein